jgi:hypothetical protein
MYFCPVPQCGRQLGTRLNLRHHFLMQHMQDLVCIPIKSSQPLPQCEQCGLQMPVEGLNGSHYLIELCQWGWERTRQHAAAVRSHEALGCLFTAYGGKMERVEVFKYLGHLIAYYDANTQAMRLNPRKTRGYWAWILRVLRAENLTARIHKVTVQADLLYGSETWSLSPTNVKQLEGFHFWAAWQMSGLRTAKKPNKSWLYPCSKDVVDTASLYTIAQYMDMHWQSVANFIVN